jgi:hypothetical protein
MVDQSSTVLGALYFVSLFIMLVRSSMIRIDAMAKWKPSSERTSVTASFDRATIAKVEAFLAMHVVKPSFSAALSYLIRRGFEVAYAEQAMRFAPSTGSSTNQEADAGDKPSGEGRDKREAAA